MSTAKPLHIAHLDLGDAAVAAALLALQRTAYRVEAALIGSDAIPALGEPLAGLVASGETFLGAWRGDELVGAVSWKIVGGVLDIHRLVVSPARFRAGIGRALVREALRLHPGLPAVVQTGAENVPARALYESERFVTVEEIEPVPGLRVVRLSRPVH